MDIKITIALYCLTSRYATFWGDVRPITMKFLKRPFLQTATKLQQDNPHPAWTFRLKKVACFELFSSSDDDPSYLL